MGSKGMRGRDRLKNVLASEAFRADVAKIRRKRDDRTAAVYALIQKYGLLQIHFPVINALVHGRTPVDALGVRLAPAAQIVDHEKRTVQPSDDPEQTYQIAETLGGFQKGVTLQINSDASEDDLIDFIKMHYKQFIKPSLTKFKRMSSEYYGVRNETIREAKDKNERVQDLADKYNISTGRVYQLLPKKKPKV